MIWHHLFFNETSQKGASEYSFGEQSDKQVDNGVAVVELRGGKIAVWREYQRRGPRPSAQWQEVEVDNRELPLTSTGTGF